MLPPGLNLVQSPPNPPLKKYYFLTHLSHEYIIIILGTCLTLTGVCVPRAKHSAWHRHKCPGNME